MVIHEWAIRKIGGEGSSPSKRNEAGFQSYLNIVPLHSYMPQKGLNIEIGSGIIHEFSYNETDNQSSDSEARRIFGVLGIINIFPISYLWVISEYDTAKELKVSGEEIFEIRKVELVPLATKDKGANKPLKDGVKRLLSSGFYFSYGYDLTKKYHRTKGDDKYWWNKNLYEDFKTHHVSSDWAVKIIQGYVGYSALPVDSHTVEITLISRRRSAMAGTRYSKRGIDDLGNVANFVETEQILQISDYAITFTQIRGSVPAFWEQTGIAADLRLTRNLDMDKLAFDKHFNDLIEDYDKIVWANLLNNKRSYELVLIRRFEDLIKKVKGPNNRYLYFNFHQEWEKDNFSALNEKLKVGNWASFLGFNISKGGKLLKKQLGVMRTNWLDWLDRTNVCQAFYSFKAFYFQLNFLKKQGVLEDDDLQDYEASGICKGIFLLSL